MRKSPGCATNRSRRFLSVCIVVLLCGYGGLVQAQIEEIVVIGNMLTADGGRSIDVRLFDMIVSRC